VALVIYLAIIVLKWSQPDLFIRLGALIGETLR
jgi:hypothetical protein